MSRATSPVLGRPAFALTALALTGAVLLNARWLPPGLLLLMIGCIVLRLALRLRRNGIVHWSLRMPLIPLFGFLIVLEYHNIFGRDAGSALLAGMLCVKLAETEVRRDARLLVTFSAFLSMCAFLFDQGPLQAAITSIEVLLLLVALRALALEPAVGGGINPLWPTLGGAGIWRMVKLLAFALPFAIACFVLFPRLQSPLWGAPTDSFADRRGLSPKVDMSGRSISALANDDTPVFRVSFQGALPKQELRYFRAFVMPEFADEGWNPPAFSGGKPALQTGGEPVDYEVVMEGTGQNWVPALDVVDGRSVDPLRLSADGALHSPLPIETAARYTLRSWPQYRLEERLSEQQRRYHLRLPANANPATQRLARQWAREVAKPLDIAQKAMDLFHESFTYSFEPGPPPPRDAIDDFLFNTRIGYCEHYASAFTFLMRAAGVPARVVVGFQGGYYNAAGGYLTVRRADAHAWSEIWIEGIGWMRVDPTGAIAPERVIGDAAADPANRHRWYSGTWLAGVFDRADTVRAAWIRAVVEFSALRQRNLAQDLGIDSTGSAAWFGLLIGAAGLGLGLAYLLGQWGRGRHPDPLLQAWQLLERRAARAGVQRGLTEGPDDFARRLGEHFPGQRPGIAALAEQFIGMRYGRIPAERARIARLHGEVRRLRLDRDATKRRADAS